MNEDDWKSAKAKPEIVKFREPQPIDTWSRNENKGEWTLGDGHGDFAIPGIHVIVVRFGGLPFAMKKEEFFEKYEVVEE